MSDSQSTASASREEQNARRRERRNRLSDEQREQARARRRIAAHQPHRRAKAAEDAKRRYQSDPERFKEAIRVWRKNNLELTRAQNKASRNRRKYNLSREDFDAMIRECNGFCPCCKTPFSLILGEQPCVDHCHKTNAVRGVLCSRCNMAIGHAGDNPEILRACARYLERHQSQGE